MRAQPHRISCEFNVATQDNRRKWNKCVFFFLHFILLFENKLYVKKIYKILDCTER